MRKTILIILTSTFMLLVFSSNTFAQKRVPLKIESKAVEANRGSNPHIKEEAPVTDKREPKIENECIIYFDNYSGLYIKVYVDGYYKGTISPYGAMNVSAPDGYTEVYLISAGGTRDWEVNGGCCNGRYTYSLY